MRLLFIGICAAATLQLACDAASEPSETTAKATPKAERASSDEDDMKGTKDEGGETREAAEMSRPLAQRFEGGASDGIQATHLHVGIPAGWKANEWGGVQLANEEGWAAAYDLPVWPPAPSHVALRTKSIGCKGVALAEGTKGKLGKEDAEAYFWEAKGTCGGDLKGNPGKPSTLWIAAKKGSDADVLIVYLHDDKIQERGKDVPNIIRPFGGA